MSSVMPEPSALHRAALTLHALAAPDRAWVLQALPPNQQLALRPMLDELQALGIPQDARLFDPLLQAEPEGETPAPAEVFAEADASRIAHMLHGEPPRVLAALLAPGDMPWLAARHRQNGEARDGREADVASPGPALQAAVRAEIRRRLDAQPRSPTAVSLWDRVRTILPFTGRAP